MKTLAKRLGWVGLVLALAVPAGLAWAGSGAAPAAAEHGDCHCCCDKACPK